MRKYYQNIVKERLSEIFEEQDVQTAMTWLISNDGRRPVIVVGAGFSLNAVDARTREIVTHADVPLWPDVLRRFKRDLRFAQGGYDGPTYAELYVEEMGTAKFNDTLLGMLKDDSIAPGKAHHALFAYPKEAIVTTNQLDTLLDKNGLRWRRVVQDHDLAICATSTSAIDVIYFHGHRDDRMSWVFTRSQYEDIYKTRPLLVTKVRQLLSQHPVLIVGYSLSDPDFHHIYRQLSLDMAYHHPLGLALFPYGASPSAAERQHWQKLGIRIATFKKAASISDQFAKFFGISPDPRAPLAGIDFVQKWVGEGQDFRDRCELARDFLMAPERSRTVGADSGDDFAIWIEPIRRQFTEEEWNGQVNSIHMDDLRYDETMEAVGGSRFKSRQPDPRAVFRGFLRIDRARFPSQQNLARQIDAFLVRPPDLRLDLARWMAFALDRDLLGHNKPLFLDLLSWLWRFVIEKDDGCRDEAEKVIRRCYARALKDGYERERKHIEEDARVAKLDVSEVTAAGDRPKEFLDKMNQGFALMLDRAYPEARQTYAQAVFIANRRGDAFGEWAAFHGEEDAMLASLSLESRASGESRNLTDDYRRRRKEMEQSPKVAEWLEDARRLQERVAEVAIEDYIREERKRTFIGRSFSFRSHPHEYWTMFRDLETLPAPPNLQAVYVRPLIDLRALEPDKELRYRLQLGVDKTEATKDWLTRIIDMPRASLATARARHDVILQEITRADTSKRERLHRLQNFSSFSGILRTQDMIWARSFLSQCHKDSSEDFDLRYSYDHDYVRALCACGALSIEPATALADLEALASGGSLAWFERHELAKQMRGPLPLEQWVGLDATAAERLVRLALKLVAATEDDDRISVDEDLAWALFATFRGARRCSRSVPADTTEEARQWALGLLQKKLAAEKSHLDGVFTAATHLAHHLAPDDSAREEVIKLALAISDQQPPEAGQGFTLGGPMGAWVSLTEAGADPSGAPMAKAAAALWAQLDATWDETLRIAGNNPDATWPYVAFLAGWITSGKAPALAQERLLLLVQAAPQHLSLCAKVLDPALWGEQWPHFLHFLWKYAAGADTNPVAARLGAVDLLLRWVNAHTRRPTDLAADLGFLLDAALLAIHDESASVANHATYAIAGYATFARAPFDVHRLASGLRLLAVNPRVIVRGAAAYAAKKILYMDAAVEIRAVAEAIDAELAADPYALVQRQRVFGELDGKVPTL